MGIAGGIFLGVLLAVVILYRNWKYEQELDSLLWKVDYRDIQINDDATSLNAGTKFSKVSFLFN